jgi:hypothetical protein
VGLPVRIQLLPPSVLTATRSISGSILLPDAKSGVSRTAQRQLVLNPG